MSLKQTIIIEKNKNSVSKIKKLNNENEEISLDISFKINKLSYFNVKKKIKINYAQGKIYLQSSKDKKNYINLSFYDTSLRLRFQGFINTKKSSFSIDINNENCVKINEIIGLIYFSDEHGESKYDMIVYIFPQKI